MHFSNSLRSAPTSACSSQKNSVKSYSSQTAKQRSTGSRSEYDERYLPHKPDCLSESLSDNTGLKTTKFRKRYRRQPTGSKLNEQNFLSATSDRDSECSQSSVRNFHTLEKGFSDGSDEYESAINMQLMPCINNPKCFPNARLKRSFGFSQKRTSNPQPRQSVGIVYPRARNSDTSIPTHRHNICRKAQSSTTTQCIEESEEDSPNIKPTRRQSIVRNS